MWDRHTIRLRFFLVMSINLVTLNHWVWPHLNADMAGTCLNSRFFFFLLPPSFQIPPIYFSSRLFAAFFPPTSTFRAGCTPARRLGPASPIYMGRRNKRCSLVAPGVDSKSRIAEALIP